jgi:hypothetical protein
MESPFSLFVADVFGSLCPIKQARCVILHRGLGLQGACIGHVVVVPGLSSLPATQQMDAATSAGMTAEQDERNMHQY